VTAGGATRACLLLLAMLVPLTKNAEAQEPETGVTENSKEMNEIKQTPKKDEAKLSPAQVSFGTPSSVGPSQFVRDFLGDEKQLWTTPAKIRFEDTSWLVPLGGFYAGLFVTDSDYSRHLSHNPTTLSHYNTLSNAGVAALVGGAGGMWLLGKWHHDEHWSETGFLAGEAAIHSLVMTEALKYTLRRERPYQGDGTGPFFQQGGTSFPSEHSALAWSVASTIAHEYPGPLTKIFAYGAAGLVSYARVRAEKHFPSDVAIGALLGQISAYQMYNQHHDPELGGDTWSSPARLFFEDGKPRPDSIGSPYVPLDSWVYPALERLTALKVLDTSFLGMRPWTRVACAKMVAEAQEREDSAPPVAVGLINELASEFHRELEDSDQIAHAEIESVYVRGEQIAGKPLTDGYHFGQTIWNDFGRPTEQGFNSIAGISSWANAGPFVVYVRVEDQHAPAAPALPLAARSFIGPADGLPYVYPDTSVPGTNRLRLLDTYVGLNLQHWQVTFGKQSLWWGPNEDGPFLFSDNAEPVTMLRLSREVPFQLPWIFSYLGQIRAEIFLGQVSGQDFVVGPNGPVGQFGKPLGLQPFFNGQKLSFKFTPNLEFGISRTGLFSGQGVPFTWHTLSLNLFHASSTIPGAQGDPGDRRSGADFSYRVPKLREWLTFYGDAFNEDEFSPLAYPRKAVFESGFYFPKLPKLNRIDLRLEGGSTVPPDFPTCNGCYYQNGRYVDGYTNYAQLMGSSIGRASQEESITSNYNFSARNKIGIELRHRKIDGTFMPQGGTQNDVAVNFDFLVQSQVSMTGMVQYEHWDIPLLAATPQSNVAASIAFTFWPGQKRR